MHTTGLTLLPSVAAASLTTLDVEMGTQSWEQCYSLVSLVGALSFPSFLSPVSFKTMSADVAQQWDTCLEYVRRKGLGLTLSHTLLHIHAHTHRHTHMCSCKNGKRHRLIKSRRLLLNCNPGSYRFTDRIVLKKSLPLT